MKKRKYQYNYSELEPRMSWDWQRKERALKIVAILNDFIALQKSKKMNQSTCLEIGSSLGEMTKIFAPFFKKVTAIDIDEKAIKKSRQKNTFKNTTFKIGDALNIPFQKESFDIVICNNIYEHVPNPKRMMREIYRVLKKGGICYFAGPNKYTLIESDHRLPFLSWFPKPIGSFYLRILGRGNYYYETTLPYHKLKKLTSKFQNYNYTIKVIKKPRKFKATHKFQGIISKIPSCLLQPLQPFMPSFFWILKKEKLEALLLASEFNLSLFY